MNQSLKIGIIGDFDQGRPSQLKTDEALDHVSNELSIDIDAAWLPTKSLEKQTVITMLREFHALWAGPGDYEKYRNDLSDGNLKITGFDEDNNARIIEIPNHRFFIATLFLPQFASKPGMSHPLL